MLHQVGARHAGRAEEDSGYGESKNEGYESLDH